MSAGAGLAIRASAGWLAEGRLVEDVTVVMGATGVDFAGASAEAPAADEIVEMDGFLLPAAADRHVHIALLDPAVLLARGVTAVRDMGWLADEVFPLADASEGPSFNGPLIRACGPMLTAVGAELPPAVWSPTGSSIAVDTPEAAAATVDELVARGAAHIKISLDASHGPVVSDAILASVTGRASETGVPVSAACDGAGQVERALGAGVSELAHTPWSERLSDSILASMAAGCRIVSTLDARSFGRDTSEVRVALDNLRRFMNLGGAVAYGTDQGGTDAPAGINERELLLLRETGMDIEAVLSSMIRAPLEPGAPGDLIVVRGDPFESLSVVTEPLMVVREGRVALSPEV